MKLELDGISAAHQRVAGLDRAITKDVVRALQTQEAGPLGNAIKGRAGAYGRIGAKAGSTVRVTNTGVGADIHGGGGGLGGVLFAGAEFGGRRKRTTYARRSRKGGAHLVHRRRSTMMFLPHLGTRGYFFWPTVRTRTKGIVGRMLAVMDKTVDHG